ncbi:MAG: ZIP family metal transporter [Woeseiaceae bacterium]|jgi:zinc and cadmium transporter
MSELYWIILGGLLMAAIAMVGSVTLVLKPATLDRLLLPLVAFAAGSLIGGAFFHMIPAAIDANADILGIGVAVVTGFTLFFVLEQVLHWHHCHRAQSDCKQPLTYLILIGDALHNFLGGLAIAGTFLIDVRLGITSWLAAAAHEVPQELGDFGVLVHGGWSKRRALLFNVLSGLTFLLGGLLAYRLSFQMDVSWLIPFAAGNFLYIGASDLVPEVNKHDNYRANAIHLMAFIVGVALLFFAKVSIDK